MEPLVEPFYTNESRLVEKMLLEGWKLTQYPPNIQWKRNAQMTDGYDGWIMIGMATHTNNGISTVDYATVDWGSHLSIKISDWDVDIHVKRVNEVYRILFANRRVNPVNLNYYLFLEPTGDNDINDLTGWYTTIIDVKFTRFNKPILSDGFGNV